MKARWQIVLLLVVAIGGGAWLVAVQTAPVAPLAVPEQAACVADLNSDGQPLVGWSGLDGVVEIVRDGQWLTNAELSPFVDQTAPGGLSSYEVSLAEGDVGAACGSVEVQQRYQCQSQESLLVTECKALVDIMFDDAGVHILNRPDFLPDADPCRWVPVDCEDGRVVSIEIDSFGLTAISPSIGNLRELRVLSARWNEITELPPEIGELSKLAAMTLRGNQLTDLPKELSELEALEHLDLDENLFASIPESLLALRDLRYLQMTGNDISAISPSIGRLRSLIGLKLLRNEIMELPVEIGGLESLEFFDLGGNLLTDLPAEFTRLTELEMLDLDSNLLTSVPTETLMALPNLTDVNLSQNQLEGPIPAALLTHPTLETLSLVGNRLEGDVPAEVAETRVEIRLGLQLGCLTTEDPELSEFMTRSYPFWQGGC